MYKQVSLSEASSSSTEASSTTHDSQSTDAIIIGAGLGGLLSAAQLLQRGKRVIIVERLNHSGGRFTAKTFQGVQVSTGAVHMVPFGSSGVLATMLRGLGIPHRLYDADVFGSFHVHGKQYRSRGLLGVLTFLGPVQSLGLLRLGRLMFLTALPEDERNLPFDQWMARYIKVEKNPQLVAFFTSIARFALSVELDQISTAEVVHITKNMFRFGAPGIVQGGCGALTRQLEQQILAQGAQIMHSCEVLQILHEEDRVVGVRIRQKQSQEEQILTAGIVVSDIGPRATDALLESRRVTQAEVLKQQQPEAEDESNWPGESVPEAVGLKVHILSDISLIPHKGIMYCLDTRRIAGMVQPTNSDPTLAPAGKHLLISHQVIQSNNVEEERALAIADLRQLFGPAFDQHCKVLTMGTYRGEWPVNRMAQGTDRGGRSAWQGLYLVGDAVKPSGYLMVEGVAQSVNRFLDLLAELDERPGRSHMLAPPSRLNALRWLWKAPGNSGQR
ncbi:phytoene desaturase family protein [Tengunoibacter tsumagoiensis]|uniref:NAD(P)/FAD-dependent oxidoreductase n=1 Tax=Tengunoibacter tsumagoiensis TaxID=2014871 RepID=A0A402A4J6_9CHLR|nr:NAD(P)/FAD-dependent oxidoreductase [Tengunoibacter tsumagoiensis]GCE13925.1 NAD(P)/FAD-dependent oxidoreductase [Tengunoibacter tsumagoiensis]